VHSFRNLVRQKQQEILQEGRKTPFFTPAIMISHELGNQTIHDIGYPERFESQRAAFFEPISAAWDVIAYEHYIRPGVHPFYATRYGARLRMSGTYVRAKDRQEPRPEIIKLGPLQVKILDALAEAGDVPHQRGQAEIEIPEDFRY
jgi:hypothetical protein